MGKNTQFWVFGTQTTKHFQRAHCPGWAPVGKFSEMVRKLGLVNYTKDESEITYPRLRTFRKKTRLSLKCSAWKGFKVW